jgi:hypothetical protein
MPFKPIDFANIQPQGNPFFRDLVENLAKGYQAGQLPAQMQRQKQKEELENALNKLHLEEEPTKFGEESQKRQLENALSKYKVQEEPQRFGSEQSTAAMERALHQTNINKINQEAALPFAGHLPSGEIGQAFALNMIKAKYGEDSQVYKDAKERYDVDVAHQKATTDRQVNLINSGQFRMLNADDKRRVIAYAASPELHYTPDEAAKELSSGKTLQDLANARGVNLADVHPNYALTTPVITQSQTRNAFISEIGELQKDLIEPLAKVSRKVGGYSPELLWGQISGKMSPEEQGKILAANALQPELAGLRARTLGAQNVGIELVKEMETKALADLKTVEGLVSPEAYRSMSYHINNYIERANEAFNRSLYNQSQLGGSSNRGEPNKKATKRFNRETGKFEVIK